MRFLGSKYQLLDELNQCFLQSVPNFYRVIREQGFADLFSGLGVVSQMYKDKAMIYANDKMYSSYLQTYARLYPCLSELSQYCKAVDNPFDFLNQLSSAHYEQYLTLASSEMQEMYVRFKRMFLRFYSESGQVKYFSDENAQKIVHIRVVIEEWYLKQQIDERLYCYLLASLGDALLEVSNIQTGFDLPLNETFRRYHKSLMLEPDFIRGDGRMLQNVEVFNEDAQACLGKSGKGVLYLDPPYIRKNYERYYHVLECVMKLNVVFEIKGSGGYPVSSLKDTQDIYSAWSCNDALKALNDVLFKAPHQYITMTYTETNSSILSSEMIEDAFLRNGKLGSFVKIPMAKSVNFFCIEK